MPIPHLVKRAWSAPLWAHALALTFLLVALMPVIDTYWQWSADEGAVLAQAQHLADGKGWRFPVPFDSVDPEGEWFPIELSEQAADGQWVPYAKLPAYPVLVAVAMWTGGMVGVALLAVLGTAVAATCSGFLARGLARSAARPALWAVGLGTPLLFYAYSVIAHSLGAAAVGVAAVGLMGWWRRGRWPWLVLVALGVVVLVALRNEGVLMIGAASVVLAISAVRARSARLLVALLAVSLPGAAMFVVNRLWYRAILDGGGTLRPPSISEPAGFLDSRWEAFVQTMVRSSGHNLLGFAALLLALLVLLARWKVSSALILRTLAVLAVVCAVMAAVLQPLGLIPGMLVVTPVVLAGVLTLRRSEIHAEVKVLLGTYLVFALGVFATQYGVGGAGEWGGRFFAIGLPLIVSIAVFSLVRFVEMVGPDRHRPVVGSVVAMSAVIAVLIVVTLRHQHQVTASVVGTIAAVAAETPAGDGGSPVVLANAAAISRLAWRDLPDGRWLLVMTDDITSAEQTEEAMRRLAEVGVDAVTVSVIPGYGRPDVDGWTLVREIEAYKGFGAAVYERDR